MSGSPQSDVLSDPAKNGGATPAPTRDSSLQCVVYISSAVELMRAAQLLGLLKSSRTRNAHAGITGMLLYREGSFMQLIEGPVDAVRALVERIGRDSRHKGMTILYNRPIRERTFGEWSMAFRNVEELDAEEQAAVSTYLDESLPSDVFGPGADRAVLLLQSFKKYIR